MNIEQIFQDAALIETKLGYTFLNKQLLSLAFVHRSYVNENKSVSHHNERLEFLGDSILGLLVAEYLYRQLPANSEGDLSSMRSRLVEASACMGYVQKLDIEEYLLLGKGEKRNDGRGRETILADLFEALIGAIYLDGGLEATRGFLFENFSTDMEEILDTPQDNWKALLQDYCQKQYQEPPFYKVLQESGPDHHKTFDIQVIIKNEIVGQGSGSSKKTAQQSAAKDAWLKIEKSN